MGRFGGPGRRSLARAQQRWLLAAAAVAAIAAVCALLHPSGAQAYPASCLPQAGSYNPTVTMVYSGVYRDDEENSTTSGWNAEYASVKTSLNWSVTVTGEIFGTNIGSCYPSPDSTTLSATGSVSATPSPNGVASEVSGCTGTLSVAPGDDHAYWGLADAAVSSPSNNPLSPDATEWGAEAFASFPVPYGIEPGFPQNSPFQSSDTNSAEVCSSGGISPPYFSAGGTDPSYENTSGTSDFVRPFFFDNIAGGFSPNGELIGPGSQTVSFSDSGTDGVGGTDTVSGSETLSYSINGSTPGLLPNPLLLAKDSSQSDLKDHVIEDGTRYCLPFAQGAGLLGAGVLLSSTPGVGLPLTVAGGLTAAATHKFCFDTVTRFVNDYRTYKDPPLQDVNVIARPAGAGDVELPKCTHGGRACGRLRGAYTKLLVAAGKLASVSGAIEQTVSRAHAAYLDGDQSALTAQEADLATLERQEKADITAERRAGKDVAAALRAGHIRFHLTRGQSAKTIDHFKHELSDRGITASDVKAIDGSAFTPAATDLLKALKDL
jgi:hypothetical protein